MANVGLSAESGDFRDGEGSRFSRVLNWAGAILSVALIAALCLWGYRLATRDVSDVPVVRASQGPMRVAPDDPGGKTAEHQGLAVNRVAAGGGVAAPAERLVLAPRPEGLADEDLPVSELRPNGETDRSPVSEYDSVSGAPDAAVIGVSAGHAAAAGNPMSMAGLTPVGEDTLLDDPTQEPRGGLARSPVPLPRPAVDLVAQSVARAVAQSVESRSVEVNPSSFPVGTPLAQFGAYDSPEIAHSEWARLTERFPEFLRGRNWFVEETVSGGRSFFRLRTSGFDSLNDSRRFCSLFTVEGQDCVAVQSRR